MYTLPITQTGNGPVIVMIHGWGQTKLVFEPLAHALKDRFRIITFDLPGHGAARDEEGPYDYRRFCRQISDTLQSLEIDEFHLLGWSMGGSVAAIYCLENYSPAPASLILLSATPRFVASDGVLGTGQNPTSVKKMSRMLKTDAEFALRGFIAGFFESGEDIRPYTREELERYFYPENFPPKQKAVIDTLAELSITDLTKHPGYYDRPVLIIYGTIDKICPPGGQKLWKIKFDHARMEAAPSAGHAPHLTRTRDVARWLAEWIAEME